MGENADGSSSAAQRAQEQTDDDAARDDQQSGRGFFSRIIEALSPPDEDGAYPANGQRVTAIPTRPGILNLRRMRVDDVAIPNAEIVAVPLNEGRDELVRIFRKSGFTRLPVFDGTLDTPVGLVHLKDFALKQSDGIFRSCWSPGLASAR